MNPGVSERPAVYVCPSNPSQAFIPTWGVATNVATGSYAVVHGKRGPDEDIDGDMKVNNTGLFNYKRFHRQIECKDGSSNTLVVGEVYAADIPESWNIWTYGGRHESTLRSTCNPLNTMPGTGITTSPYGIELNGAFGSRHFGGAVFGFADGHTQFIANTIPLDIYKALSTKAGDEIVAIP